MTSRIGTIVAVCTSPKDGIQKYPQKQVEIGRYGLVGDYHNRARRRSFSIPGMTKPNIDRHITVVAEEVFDALNAELGTKLVAGSFGENFLVRGLGDLSDIKDDARLLINEIVVLRVIEQNKPCKNLAPYHRLMVKKAHGRRGLLCAIERGFYAFVGPDDTIAVV